MTFLKGEGLVFHHPDGRMALARLVVVSADARQFCSARRYHPPATEYDLCSEDGVLGRYFVVTWSLQAAETEVFHFEVFLYPVFGSFPADARLLHGR